MIQSPHGDGPPELDVYLDKSRRIVGATGPPINFATGRALLHKHAEDPDQTAAAAITTALDGLQTKPPTFAHVTYSLDVDADTVAQQVDKLLPGVPVVGRSVNKKDAAGTVEVLLLQGDSPVGFQSASAEVSSEGSEPTAMEAAAKEATVNAVSALGEGEELTFLVFAHSSVAAGDESARRGIGEAEEGVIAYGGPAVGAKETGTGWSVLGGVGGEVRVTRGGDQVAVVAAVAGSISFLASAVVKSWAQPAYVAPLSFMQARYVGDASLDLLTAIRYDDWEKFIWCLGDGGVDVNVKWTEKQNQIPLLAACARARTKMVGYLLDKGADVGHRNDGGFTAAMYTRMLTEYDQSVVREQLDLLEKAGMDTKLSDEDRERLGRATNGRIVE